MHKTEHFLCVYCRCQMPFGKHAIKGIMTWGSMAVLQMLVLPSSVLWGHSKCQTCLTCQAFWQHAHLDLLGNITESMQLGALVSVEFFGPLEVTPNRCKHIGVVIDHLTHVVAAMQPWAMAKLILWSTAFHMYHADMQKWTRNATTCVVWPRLYSNCIYFCTMVYWLIGPKNLNWTLFA